VTEFRTVLHLIETVGIGGAERVLLDLVRKLDRHKWRCSVVVPCDGWLRHRLLEEGIETVILEESGPFDIKFLFRVAALARRLNADIIHSHLFGSAVRAGLVSRACGIPAVGTIHGQVDFHHRENYRGLKLALVRGGVERLVFVSEPLRQSSMAAMKFPRDRTSVIHNGVDAELFAPARATPRHAEFRTSAEEFVVGYVGRLHPVKGLETFLKAASILKSIAGGYRFVIVGDGDERYTRELAALRDGLGLANDVVFAGFRADVHNLMSEFDAYALTSHSEGFSISTIEAMASGVPVVATRCGGPEQIIENGVTGLLVDNGSSEAIARGPARLRTDPDERRRFAAAARASVLGRFTVDAQVRAYEQLYENVLAPRRHRNVQPRASFAP